MWTKRQLVEAALSELGVFGNGFTVTPEQYTRGLTAMDTLIATWEGDGVVLGYRLPAGPDDSDPDDDSGIPDGAAMTVYTSVALRLAASYGKQVSSTTLQAANSGYGLLLRAASTIPRQQYPSTLPRGAGTKPFRTLRPFYPRPTDDPIGTAEGGDLNFKE
jgi:hypothetical protein